LWVNAYDVHPNAKGHAIFAEVLRAGLATLPGECWHTRAERRAQSSR